jgi:hypothetical protein
MMVTFLRWIEFLTLGTWFGADVFLSFVVAPGAFAVLANRDSAGLVVGHSLARLHTMGIVLGLVFLVVRFARAPQVGTLTSAATLCVVLMILLTGVSQFTVSRRMQVLRQEMGSVQSTAEGNPRRVEFNRLHQRSVMFEGGVLLLGLAAMFLLVRETVSGAPR